MKKFLAVICVLTMILCLSACNKVEYNTDLTDANNLYPSDVIKDDGSLKIIGHRGLSSKAPENTLSAFDLACRSADWGTEMDVYPTADGQWVVIHDPKLNRTTDGRGKVIKKTYEEISAFSVDSGSNIETFPDEKVSLLSDVLDLIENYSTVPVIEIKDFTEEAAKSLADIITSYADYRNFVIISFDGEALLTLKEFLPENTMWLLTEKVNEEVVTYAKESGFDGVDFNYKKAGEEQVKMITDAGLDALMWTVDSVEIAEEFYGYGCTGITTNSIVPYDTPASIILESETAELPVEQS